MIDMAGNGDADQLAVVANPNNGAAGIASIGGSVLISPVDGYLPHYGDSATILTAEGGVDGTFNANSSALSAILYPTFTYGANSVDIQIAARPYLQVVDPNSAVQTSYASLLDRSRGHYDQLAGLYNQLDLLSAGAIGSTLESMAPRTETTRTELGVMASDNMAGFYRDRLALARTGDAGGTLAMIGQPLQLAALSNTGMPLTPEVQHRRRRRHGIRAEREAAEQRQRLYRRRLYGRPFAVRCPPPPRRATIRSTAIYIAAGGEVTDDAGGVVGLSLSYSDVDGDATGAATCQGQALSGHALRHGRSRRADAVFPGKRGAVRNRYHAAFHRRARPISICASTISRSLRPPRWILARISATRAG